MAADDDLLTSLISGKTPGTDQMTAIANQLRNRGNLGALAAMSGDPALGPFGHQVLAQNQQEAENLGQRAEQNTRVGIAQSQFERQLTQGQNALAETVRYHNLEDQERKDRLAEQTAAQGNSTANQPNVNAILAYQAPLPNSRAKGGQAIIDQVFQQDPTYDNTKYLAKQKAQKDFSTGAQGNMVRAAPVALQHLDLADSKVAALDNSPFPAYNAVRNTLGPMFGNTGIAKAVAGLNTGKTIVSDEIDKFFINGGGAEKDRQHLQDSLASANSGPALREVTDTLRQLMAGQMNGLKSQYEDNVIGGDFIHDKVKDPNTLRTLGWDGTRFTGMPSAVAKEGAPSALPGALGAGAPTGSAPPASAVPGAPGASQTGAQAPTVVRTGTRMGGNGQKVKVAQMSDGTVVEQ